MTITINGEARQVPPGISVAELLTTLRLVSRQVAVEVNLELVPRSLHRERSLEEGDRLEIVTLVGGG